MNLRSTWPDDDTQPVLLITISRHPTELDETLITVRVNIPKDAINVANKPKESIWVIDISGSMGSIEDPNSELSLLKKSLVQHVQTSLQAITPIISFLGHVILVHSICRNGHGYTLYV